MSWTVGNYLKKAMAENQFIGASSVVNRLGIRWLKGFQARAHCGFA